MFASARSGGQGTKSRLPAKTAGAAGPAGAGGVVTVLTHRCDTEPVAAHTRVTGTFVAWATPSSTGMRTSRMPS